jgi:hypothetical protein
MKTVFLGDEGRTSKVSNAMGANAHSPPDESVHVQDNYFRNIIMRDRKGVDAWLEIWDYTGACSFRGFVGGEGEKKALFVFFDESVIERDLKQGYVYFPLSNMN